MNILMWESLSPHSFFNRSPAFIFLIKMKVNASHILVKTEQEANVALYDITHGGKFEDIAAKISLCPSKKKGGSLGWFSRGQMAKEFEQACFSHKKGDLVGPVKTQFGWHIIRIDDVK